MQDFKIFHPTPPPKIYSNDLPATYRIPTLLQPLHYNYVKNWTHVSNLEPDEFTNFKLGSHWWDKQKHKHKHKRQAYARAESVI